MPHQIATTFYSLSGGQRDSVLNNASEENSISSRAHWYNYDFAFPVYLTEIRITADGFSGWNSFYLRVNHVDGSTHEQNIPVNNGVILLKLGKLCTAFGFKPEGKVLSRPIITSVSASGLTTEEFHQFEWAIKDYDENIKSLEKREASLANLEVALPELRTEKSALESEIGKSRAELETLMADIGAKKIIVGSKQDEIIAKEISLRDLVQQNYDAQDKNIELVEKRQAIIAELRNYPTEITGFIKEGNRSVRWYVALGAPFLIVLSIIVYKMFSSAIDLTQLYKQPDGVDVWVIFLTRLPFVILAVAIIEVCGSVCGRLVFEVIRINRQRLDFSKLSIIAKDVSITAANESTLSAEEVFDREVRLRMDLLREHMKNYTGSEFENRGSALISAVVGVVERFAKQK